jgi:hypothetical protein
MPDGDDRDDFQRSAPETRHADRPQYHHDPQHGETRYPPQSGPQHSGRPGHDDPHSVLNTPVSEIEAEAEVERLGHRDPISDVTGMGRAQTSDTRGTDGDPVMRGSGDRETHNPAQTTPRGVQDAEEDAMRRVQEHTGVPLVDDPADDA